MDYFEMNTNFIAKIKSTSAMKLLPLVSGYTPAKADIIVSRMAFIPEVLVSPIFLSQSFAGYNGSNTALIENENGIVQRVYLSGVIAGTDYTVTAYSDSARLNVVATGLVVLAVGGVVTLAEQNGSGLTGSVEVIPDATNQDWYTDIMSAYAKYDAAVDAGQDNIEGIYYSDDDDPENATYGMIFLVQAADGINIDKLGYSGVTDALTRKALITQMRNKGLFV